MTWSRGITYPTGFSILIISIIGIWLYSALGSGISSVKQSPPSLPKNTKQIAALMFMYFIIWWAVVGLLVYFKNDILGIDIYEVSGESMEPTLTQGSYVLIDTWIYKNRPPRRGDIVLFKLNYGDTAIVKRIGAQPGDQVTHNRANIKVEASSSLQANKTDNFTEPGSFTQEKTIPDGYYFVVGDNIKKSQDSRIFGSIGRETILGKVAFVLW